MFLVGCGGGNLEKAVIGKYTIDINSDKMEEKDKAALKMGEAFLKGISLEIKEGGKCEMSAMGQKETGTWTLNGTTLTVTDDKNKKAEKMEVKDNGETLVPDAKSMGTGDMKGAVITFKKGK